MTSTTMASADHRILCLCNDMKLRRWAMEVWVRGGDRHRDLQTQIAGSHGWVRGWREGIERQRLPLASLNVIGIVWLFFNDTAKLDTLTNA